MRDTGVGQQEEHADQPEGDRARKGLLPVLSPREPDHARTSIRSSHEWEPEPLGPGSALAEGCARYASTSSSSETSWTVHAGSRTGPVVRTKNVDCRCVWLEEITAAPATFSRSVRGPVRTLC